MPAGATAAFAGTVLTGGRSTRMGRDKALVEVDGVPMVLRVAEALRGAGAEPVVAVGGDGDALTGLALPWHADHYPGEGPLGGLLTAFTVLAEHELVAVAATDLPWLSPDVVRELVDAVDGRAAALARSDRLEPLCGVWRVGACAPALARAFGQGERAVHRALAGLDRVQVAVPADALRNVNTLGDLDR